MYIIYSDLLKFLHSSDITWVLWLQAMETWLWAKRKRWNLLERFREGGTWPTGQLGMPTERDLKGVPQSSGGRNIGQCPAGTEAAGKMLQAFPLLGSLSSGFRFQGVRVSVLWNHLCVPILSAKKVIWHLMNSYPICKQWKKGKHQKEHKFL